MYTPSHFAESNPEVLDALMRAHPLATLVVPTPEGLLANAIPLVLRRDAQGGARLAGHVARQNPVWRSAAQPGLEALAIFHGPSHYISPSWYPSKQEHGRVVPTWNYIMVQAHGPMVVHEDPEWIRAQVEELTRQQEASQPVPWSVSDAPREYLERMFTQIVGIELVVTRLEGKWKVSQNQPAANREGVLAALDALAAPDASLMAEAIRQRPPPGPPAANP